MNNKNIYLSLRLTLVISLYTQAVSCMEQLNNLSSKIIVTYKQLKKLSKFPDFIKKDKDWYKQVLSKKYLFVLTQAKQSQKKWKTLEALNIYDLDAPQAAVPKYTLEISCSPINPSLRDVLIDFSAMDNITLSKDPLLEEIQQKIYFNNETNHETVLYEKSIGENTNEYYEMTAKLEYEHGTTTNRVLRYLEFSCPSLAERHNNETTVTIFSSSNFFITSKKNKNKPLKLVVAPPNGTTLSFKDYIKEQMLFFPGMGLKPTLYTKQ